MQKFVLTAQIQLQSPKNIGAIVKTMQQQLGAVNVKVKPVGVAQTTQQMKALQQATNKTADSVDRLAKTFAVSFKRFVTFSIATRFVGLFSRGLNDALNSAIKFERELIKVSQVSGKTTSELKPLVKEVDRLATSLGVSSDSLIVVARTLTQAGFSANDAKIAMEALAKTDLAPTFEDITKTTEGAIAIFNQFRSGAEALEGQLGAINAVAGKFAVESGDLISVVRRVGGVFKTAGGDLNQLLALFTSVRSTTRESAESIATGLRTIFVRIQRPKTLKFLEELGVKLTDLNGRFIGPMKAVEALNKAFGNLKPGDPLFIKVAEEIAGFRQIGKVLPLIQQYAVAQEALNVAKAGENSLNDDAIKAQQALAVRMTKVREEFLSLVRAVYESPVFKLMANSGLELASALIKVGKAMKDIIPILGVFAAFQITKNMGSFFGSVVSHVKKPQGFAVGGGVPGVGNSDTVPAMLTPGEFVINKRAAKNIGYGNLKKMNSVQHLNKGGVVLEAQNPQNYAALTISGQDELYGYDSNQGRGIKLSSVAARSILGRTRGTIDSKELENIDLEGKDYFLKGKFPIYSLESRRPNVSEQVKEVFDSAVKVALDSAGKYIHSSKLADFLDTEPINTMASKNRYNPQQLVDSAGATLKGYLLEGTIGSLTGNELKGKKEGAALDKFSSDFDFENPDVDRLRKLYNIPPGVDEIYGADAKSSVATAKKNATYVAKVAKDIGLRAKIISAESIQSKQANDLTEAKNAAKNTSLVADINKYITGPTGRTGSNDYFISRSTGLEKPSKATTTYPKLLKMLRENPDSIINDGKFTYNAEELRKVFQRYGVKFAKGGMVGYHSIPGFKPDLKGRGLGAANLGRNKQYYWQALQYLKEKQATVGLTPEEEQKLKELEIRVKSVKTARGPRFSNFMFSGGMSEVAAKLSRNAGGPIPGVGNTDTVPAMLTPGEFVINKNAAKNIGINNLHKMNKGRGYNKGGVVQHFKRGGIVKTVSEAGFGGQMAMFGVMSTLTSSISSMADESSTTGKIMSRLNSSLIQVVASVGILHQIFKQANQKEKQRVRSGVDNIRSLKRNDKALTTKSSEINKDIGTTYKLRQNFLNRKNQITSLQASGNMPSTNFLSQAVDNYKQQSKKAGGLNPAQEQQFKRYKTQLNYINKVNSTLDQLNQRYKKQQESLSNVNNKIRENVKELDKQRKMTRNPNITRMQERGLLPAGLADSMRGISNNLKSMGPGLQKFSMGLMASVTALQGFADAISQYYRDQSEKSLEKRNYDDFVSQGMAANSADKFSKAMSGASQGGMAGAGIGMMLGGPAGAAVGGILGALGGGIAALVTSESSLKEEIKLLNQVMEKVVENMQKDTQAFMAGDINLGDYNKRTAASIEASSSGSMKKFEDLAELKGFVESSNTGMSGVGFGGNGYDELGYSYNTPLKYNIEAMLEAAKKPENSEGYDEDLVKQVSEFKQANNQFLRTTSTTASEVAGADNKSIQSRVEALQANIDKLTSKKVVDKYNLMGQDEDRQRTVDSIKAMQSFLQVVQKLVTSSLENLQVSSAFNKAIMNMDQSMSAFAGTLSIADKAAQDIKFSFQNLGGSEQANNSIDKFQESLSNRYGENNPYIKNISDMGSKVKESLAGVDKFRKDVSNINIGDSRAEIEEAIKKIAEENFENDIGQAFANSVIASIGSGDMDEASIAKALQENGDKFYAEVEKAYKPYFEAMESQKKWQENVTKLTQELAQSMNNYIDAQKRAIEIQKQADGFLESFGGKKARDSYSYAVQSLNAQGKALRMSSNGNDLSKRSQESLSRYEQIRAEQKKMVNSGDYDPTKFNDLEIEAQRLMSYGQALVDTQQAQIASIQEAISIQEKKNQLEKDSLQALISGDLKAYMKQQSAVGAQAAVASGDSRLINSFGATAIGDAMQNLQKLQEGGVNSLYGQSIGGAGGLMERASAAGLSLRGITDPREAQMLAGTDMETERLRMQGRMASQNLASIGNNQVGYAAVDYNQSLDKLRLVNLEYEKSIIGTTEALNRFKNSLENGPSRIPVHRAFGGIIPGVGNSDTVPALLTPGEFVINKHASRSIGYATLNKMNNVQRFNTGGVVNPVASPSMMSISIDESKLAAFTSNIERLSNAVEKLSSSEIKITGVQTVNVNVSSSDILNAVNQFSQDAINKAISDRFNNLGKELQRPQPRLNNLGGIA